MLSDPERRRAYDRSLRRRAAEEGGFDVSRYSNVRDWAERMLALPGSGHPYSVMPKEDRPAA